MEGIAKFALLGIGAYLGYDYLQKRSANKEAATSVLQAAATAVLQEEEEAESEEAELEEAELEEEGEEGADAEILAVSQAVTRGAVYNPVSLFHGLPYQNRDGWDSDNLI